MASAINYNTVWTSIFEPMATFGFLERYGRTSPDAQRHDLPHHVVGSDLSGVVLRTGPGGRLWKPGQEAVAHCLSVELESADAHDDTMLDPEQRIWVFETNFGGLAGAGRRQDQPAHAQGRAPDVGGGRLPRVGQQHGIPAAHLAQRRRDEARRRRPRLGGERRARLLRDPAGPRRRRDSGLCRLVAGQGRPLPTDGGGARHRPFRRRRRGIPVLDGREHPGPLRVEAPRRTDPRADRRQGPGHRPRAPGPRDLRGERLRRAFGAAPSSAAHRRRATCTSTTTATSR